MEQEVENEEGKKREDRNEDKGEISHCISGVEHGVSGLGL